MCAVFLSKYEDPVISIINLLSEIYYDVRKGPGYLSLNDVNHILTHTADMETEDIEEIFEKLDSKREGVITIGK